MKSVLAGFFCAVASAFILLHDLPSRPDRTTAASGEGVVRKEIIASTPKASISSTNSTSRGMPLDHLNHLKS
eukprot:1160689-Pelagomonas_calceolata.AAC.6